jgi:biotin operon repressor
LHGGPSDRESPMDDLKRETQLILRVLDRIQQHTYNHPITIPVLAVEFGISERKVKQVIEELRDGGHKVGSHKEKPYGVFIARCPIEIHPTAMRIRKEGVKFLKKANQLMDFSSAHPTVFEQPIDIPSDST